MIVPRTRTRVSAEVEIASVELVEAHVFEEECVAIAEIDQGAVSAIDGTCDGQEACKVGDTEACIQFDKIIGPEVFDDVLSGAVDEDIGPAAAEELIIALSAIEAVIVPTTIQFVIACAAIEDVIACIAIKLIVSGVAKQGVVTATTDEFIFSCRTVQYIRAICPDDIHVLLLFLKSHTFRYES